MSPVVVVKMPWWSAQLGGGSRWGGVVRAQEGRQRADRARAIALTALARVLREPLLAQQGGGVLGHRVVVREGTERRVAALPLQPYPVEVGVVKEEERVLWQGVSYR